MQSELPVADKNDVEAVKLDNADAQKTFAQLLSKAVYNSVEVRTFLKNEAMAQFDNDYDVFYPFVKDKVVCDGKTFRDILLSYCDREEELVQIEESLLLLNILVPDMTLFWDFNAETWDVSDADVGVISRDDDDNTVYMEGEAIGSLTPDEIPGFPCLVVKNNERMVVANGMTRSTNVTYKFADDAYNPAKTGPKTRSDSYDADLEALPEIYPYAKSTDLDPLVIAAYNEFNTIDNRPYQRDNVYYGMTKSISTGDLRPNIQEEILMFRLSSNNYNVMSDETKDPTLNTEGSGPGKGHNGWSNEQIISQIWKEGSFEFVFKIFITNGINSQPSQIEKRISVKANKLFALSKIHVDYTNGTLIRRKDWVYTANSNFLVPRWVRVGTDTGLPGAIPVYLPPWELYEGSTVRYIGVFESDETGTRTETFSWTDEFSKTFDSSGEVNIGKDTGVISGGIKVGYGTTTKETKQTSISTTVAIGSDTLGDVDFRYSDPIIVSDSEKSTKGYRMNAISTGEVEIVFAPRRK
jgi:hypothetical protein